METEVNQLYDKARAMGISGVPVIIIDGKWAIKGGHSSEVFVQVRFFPQTCMKLRSLIIHQIFKRLAICNNSLVSNGSDSFVVVDTLTT